MENKTITYLSGPMSGIEDFNLPAFHDAAEFLRDRGFVVENPAENFNGYTELNREFYLWYDIKKLNQMDAIAVLPGWDQSAGAMMEVLIGSELGKTIFRAYYPSCHIQIQKIDVQFDHILEDCTA